MLNFEPTPFLMASQAAWLEGAHAAKMCMPKAANPYPKRQRPYLRKCWLAGYRGQDHRTHPTWIAERVASRVRHTFRRKPA